MQAARAINPLQLLIIMELAETLNNQPDPETLEQSLGNIVGVNWIFVL